MPRTFSISSVQLWTAVTGHNGHKPKRPQPKRPQTETATNRNGHRPKRPQTGTATNRNGHRPKWPQTETATNRNGHRPERPQTETATTVVTHHIRRWIQMNYFVKLLGITTYHFRSLVYNACISRWWWPTTSILQLWAKSADWIIPRLQFYIAKHALRGNR